MRDRDAAKLLGRHRPGKTRHADESLWLERLAHFADLIAPPQHRQHGNAESGAPGGEKRERLQREIGELHRDPVAGLKPDLDEERGERIDRGVGLGKAIGMRAPELERLGVGWVT
jgi:hypothetical protein